MLCTGSTRLEKAGILDLMALSYVSRLLSSLVRESGMLIRVRFIQRSKSIDSLKQLSHKLHKLKIVYKEGIASSKACPYWVLKALHLQFMFHLLQLYRYSDSRSSYRTEHD